MLFNRTLLHCCSVAAAITLSGCAGFGGGAKTEKNPPTAVAAPTYQQRAPAAPDALSAAIPVSHINPEDYADRYLGSSAWGRVRMGMRLGGLGAQARPEVQRELQIYADNPATVEAALARAQPFIHYIVAELARRRMPMEIALLPVVESNFVPTARSPAGAAGVWQFIPATATRYGLRRNNWYDGRMDVLASTNAALDYLQKLHQQLNRNWLHALAAYNCGEGAVARAVAANQAAGQPIDFFSLDLPRETSVYVPKLLALGQVIAAPQRYNVKLPLIPNTPQIAVVPTPRQTDLNKAAALAGLPPAEVKALNTGLLRGVTEPQGPHQLVLPAARVEAFTTALKREGDRVIAVQGGGGAVQGASGSLGKIDHDTRIHTVASGETLGHIAEKYGVSVGKLMSWNNLSVRSTLQIKQKLIVSNIN